MFLTFQCKVWTLNNYQSESNFLRSLEAFSACETWPAVNAGSPCWNSEPLWTAFRYTECHTGAVRVLTSWNTWWILGLILMTQCLSLIGRPNEHAELKCGGDPNRCIQVEIRTLSQQQQHQMTSLSRLDKLLLSVMRQDWMKSANAAQHSYNENKKMQESNVPDNIIKFHSYFKQE